MSANGNPIEYFGLYCPAGGDFYICQDSRQRFIGCCDDDPCADGSGSCPPSSLHQAGFDASRYSEILSQDCEAPQNSTDWFTCVEGPFMGCCKSNPCAGDGSCPDDDLVAARLSDDPDDARIFLISSASSTSPNPTSSATTSPSSSPGPSNGTDASGGGGPPVAKIVGGTVAGVAALILIVCFVFLYMRKRAADAREKQSATDHHTPAPDSPWSPYKDSSMGSPNIQEAPSPSPALSSPPPAHDGRFSLVSQPSSQSPTWDSRHVSYTTTGAPSPMTIWTGGAVQQQQRHQLANINPVSELEGSTAQYHELDAAPVSHERR
ncbi:hypothetical protein GGR52DRAFT_566037 [Hypoxylon sp. FL1284]|nr:hypothetical protein GGR52DRAFT_566037 [Hypoxylon sp. FL1284]